MLIAALVVLLLFAVLVFCWRSHRIPVHLVEDWRGFLGLLSTKAAMLMSAATTAIAAYGDTLSKAWEHVPDSLRDHLPESLKQIVAGLALFLAFMAVFLAARLTKQPVTKPSEQKP